MEQPQACLSFQEAKTLIKQKPFWTRIHWHTSHSKIYSTVSHVPKSHFPPPDWKLLSESTLADDIHISLLIQSGKPQTRTPTDVYHYVHVKACRRRQTPFICYFLLCSLLCDKGRFFGFVGFFSPMNLAINAVLRSITQQLITRLQVLWNCYVPSRI